MDYPQMLLHICICFQCGKDPMEIPETIEVIGIILSFLLIDTLTCCTRQPRRLLRRPEGFLVPVCDNNQERSHDANKWSSYYFVPVIVVRLLWRKTKVGRCWCSGHLCARLACGWIRIGTYSTALFFRFRTESESRRNASTTVATTNQAFSIQGKIIRWS